MRPSETRRRCVPGRRAWSNAGLSRDAPLPSQRFTGRPGPAILRSTLCQAEVTMIVDTPVPVFSGSCQDIFHIGQYL
jgi:hypothetical protein